MVRQLRILVSQFLVLRTGTLSEIRLDNLQVIVGGHCTGQHECIKLLKKMEIKNHVLSNIKIAEVVSDTLVIKTSEDGLDLLGNLYYQDFGNVIIHEENITPDFFDLKNGMAGEILQKFSNYRIRLAIVGDFTPYASKSIKDFIYESNRRGQINFVSTITEALNVLSK